MTGDDLRRLEAAIGRSLPRGVQKFFLNFPPGLRTPEEELDPDFSEFELTDDADALIQMNAAGPYNLSLPEAGPNFFALGSGGCGETWWIELDTENGTVYFADAGTYARHSDHVADSLAEFAQGILDGRRETNG
jgi:hypothetical protein